MTIAASPPARLKTSPKDLRSHLRRLGDTIMWDGSVLLFKLFYGLTIEGMENVPSGQPYVLVVNEFSPLALINSGWLARTLLLRAYKEVGRHRTFYFMREELFKLAYLSQPGRPQVQREHAPLLPQAAGPLALSLLDGLEILRDGGFVIINPEGDMPWDGRPLPVRDGIAWLALHSGAQLVLGICSVSAYDAWPRWQRRPFFSGHITLKIRPPITLTDRPRPQVSERELAEASARVREELDRVRYNPIDPAEWAGLPRYQGQALKAPPRLYPAQPGDGVEVPLTSLPPPLKRGITLLLWRCPLCHTHDALRERRSLFGKWTVNCTSCGASWQVQRVIEHDFRLELKQGPPELVGLDMALSTWYDEMKRGFEPCPIQAGEVDLEPGEQVFLECPDATLQPHRPNALYEEWNQREAPRSQQSGKWKPADWESIGTGRLLLTNRRMLWIGGPREVEFKWSGVSAGSLWLINTLFVRYGMAPYRIGLGQENGLKWLTHVDAFASRAAAEDGHTLLPIHL